MQGGASDVEAWRDEYETIVKYLLSRGASLKLALNASPKDIGTHAALNWLAREVASTS